MQARGHEKALYNVIIFQTLDEMNAAFYPQNRDILHINKSNWHAFVIQYGDTRLNSLDNLKFIQTLLDDKTVYLDTELGIYLFYSYFC